ncbi:hypothetical protein BKA10_003022 [Microbacterium invictum]|uniref:Uncharacterized protein n=1 Tax=Microbacterium invictum TaxID=515415 RepID=A0AA40VPD6_9MICO|nr:hypothetical protein [Microbacterium invictum]
MPQLIDEEDDFEDALEREWRRTYGTPGEERLAG